MFWNYHERTRGVYDFARGTRRDLAGFLQMAGDAGLFVNVRIGPYVCAEWNGGGFPLWLKGVANLTCVRCSDPVWEREMSTFVEVVANVVRPYLARRGGPVIMAQIENELHSSPSDPYVAWCGELAQSLDLDVPWVMCNGASANGTVNTCNGNTCGTDMGYADTHAARFPGQPLGWTEDWSWFTTWGGSVTDHPPGPFSLNVAQWMAKGGAHHNYYMYYGGNHVESWGASGLTNRYGDGSNIHSDGLPNEPKKSHLARMHRALARMNDVLLAAPVQTRASAVAVVPCPPPPTPRASAHGQPRAVCVNGTAGTGAVACDPADQRQRFRYTGAANTSGAIVQVSASGARLCVSGACATLPGAGCVPLPLVPCKEGDAAQQWTWVVVQEQQEEQQGAHAPPSSALGPGRVSSAWMVNKQSGGCLSSWSKHAIPGDPGAYPLTGVAECATGWGTGVYNWAPENADGTFS